MSSAPGTVFSSVEAEVSVFCERLGYVQILKILSCQSKISAFFYIDITHSSTRSGSILALFPKCFAFLPKIHPIERIVVKGPA